MVEASDLTKLTAVTLLELAKNLNINISKAKKETMAENILKECSDKSKLEQELATLKGKKVKPVKPSLSKTVKLPAKDDHIVSLEKRVGIIEEQIKYIISKLTSVDVKLAPTTMKVDFVEIEKVKSIITSMIRPGESISIESIFLDSRISQHPPAVIEKAILGLIDDEVCDSSEGSGERKIRGTIGRLIRR